MTEIEQLKLRLEAATREQREEIFRWLRREFQIHPLEAKLGAAAEVILEAIDRSSDLTLRGIRGVIAEAAFATDVLSRLSEWRDTTPPGNHPFDFQLEDGLGAVRVQVKMQRQKQHRPLLSEQAPRWAHLPSNHFVVETQRTRGGVRGSEKTRPYRFREFDVLAVSMHPSTGNWSSFIYTVADWLKPHPENPQWIQTFQAVPARPDSSWTDDLLVCIEWFRSGVSRVQQDS